MGVNATVTEAQDVGLGAWTLDPAYCTTSGSFTATTQYLAAFYWRPGPGVAPFPSTILIPGVVVGSWTKISAGIICMDQCGQNAPGTLLTSGAQASPAAGINVVALTAIAAAPAVLPPGRYWVVMTPTGTTGTAQTAPSPVTASSGSNMGTDLAHARFGTSNIANATLASLAPASITTVATILQLCAGVL
jgi:hypothetical protein